MAKRTVLVVTDDDTVSEEVTFAFPQDTEVVVARDSREATRILREISPDALVVEIRTGSAGGFGLARDLRQSVTLRDVPILMLLEREQDEWLARQAGAAATVIQPIEAGDLVDATLRLIPSPS